MKQPIILFAEDEPKVASSVKQGLEENGFDVEIAPVRAVGRFLGVSKKYDLILLDVNLPHLSGYEVCKAIREKDPIVPIILVTAMQSIENKISGFDVGADDYIVKPFDFRELLARIKAVLKRKQQGAETEEASILTVEDLVMNLDEKTVARQGENIALTAKEFALLEYLIKRKGRVVSRADISEHVWDLNFDTGTNVVDVYINFLRKKIDKNYERKLIHTKPGMGYFLK